MHWNFQEALTYYKDQGAPGNQTALISLLREMQDEHGGAIPAGLLPEAAQALGIKETFLRAIIGRFPSLHLADCHVLELCGGPNCSKRAKLAQFVEETYGAHPPFTLRYVGCMRQCGKGPNLKWDGTLYHQADEALIQALVEGKK